MLGSRLESREARRRGRLSRRNLIHGVISVIILVFIVYVKRSKKPVFRALVSYVYFESNSQDSCEVFNKRQNLAFFIHEAVLYSPPNIQFVFSFPEKLPSATSLIDSLGISIRSETALLFYKVITGEVRNVRIIHPSSSQKAPDLCHHWSVLKGQTSFFNHFVVLNDGVRGPFISDGLQKVSSEPR